ncbi:LuxR family transcriptional regulator [Achromobacter sp. RTa]|uniref:helix-turn-helix transcriptional regulator n=1 Tax=Achromobacter sp. RTa TaxID=1532557 RepID=UPI0005101065|nr:helix-turn-helix transcriptional regulator [Achromobacter sp. RTa]KGD86836.1 LuxR family transcriptional regulator [Achromobacter sp. RTa]
MEETNHPLPAAEERDRWAESAVMDLGGPMFHAALLLALRETVAADHVSHVFYGHDGAVQYSSAASLLNQSLIEWTTNVFVDDEFYRRDPNYGLLLDMAGRPDHHPDPVIQAASPDRILDSEYRRLLFERPGFASKISLIGARGEGISYLNLYFSRTHSPDVTELMRGRAPLLIALARRHHQLCRREGEAQRAASWRSGLSLREIQVAELLRQGHTAKEVGRELGLSPATVVTYKNRLFKKNNVASLKEFLIKTPVASGCTPANAS